MARSVRELASSFPCRFGYSPQSSPHFPPFARMRNESTLIVRNYAHERRDPREEIYASCSYRYLARLRRFRPYGRAHQPSSDAAGGTRPHQPSSNATVGTRAHQPSSDAAGGKRPHQPSSDAAGGKRAHQPSSNASGGTRAHQPSSNATVGTRSYQPSSDATGLLIDIICCSRSSLCSWTLKKERIKAARWNGPFGT
jgi:hypothetical protein